MQYPSTKCVLILSHSKQKTKQNKKKQINKPHFWSDNFILFLLAIPSPQAIYSNRMRAVCSVASVMSNSLLSYGSSPPGSSVHVIFQARILEQVAVPSSRGSSQLRDLTGKFKQNKIRQSFWGSTHNEYQYLSLKHSFHLILYKQ